MTVTFHALWMLCALSAATFAAAAAPRRRWLIALAIGFLAVVTLSVPEQLPDPEVAGLCAAAGAIVYLFRPRYAWLALLLGGALAGMLIQVVSAIGLPSLWTAPAVAAGMAGTVWLARTRPAFAPETLREEALLLVCTLGLAVAVLPSVLDGWQAAANLNIRVENVATQAIPAWTLTVVAMSTLLGAGVRAMESPVNLLPILENGLFALGQVLRFPVFVLLWVCVASAVFMTGSCVVDFVARRRERRAFDITAWLKSGTAIQASAARLRLLPAGLRQMLRDVEDARAQDALGDGGLEHLVLEREERVRRSLNRARMMVRVGPSLGLIGTLIPMGSSLASMAAGNLEAMAGQMVVAFTSTIIGLATGTLVYVVAAARQNWVMETVREQRYLAEQVAREMQSSIAG